MRPGLLALVGAADQHRVGVHPDQLQALEVVEDARHRHREHALALEHARRDAAGRLQLVVLEREAERAQLLAELRARHVVEFVTKRSRWPASRRRRTASTAPGIGSPETCSTPSTSRRIAAMDAESIRSEVAFRVLPLERSGRPARAEELDPRRGAVRRRGLGGADASAERAARAREARPGRARDRAGRALAAPEPRARDRADRRAAARGGADPPRAASRPRRPRRRASGGSTRRSAAARRSACAGARRDE